MNKFQTVESGKGMLKNDADVGNESPVLAALKRRSEKLTNKIAIPTKDKLEGNEEEPGG